jgi:preprotein translocase subunit SecY
MSSAVELLASNLNLKTFSKAQDLKKRLWFTLLALIVYRFGTYVPLPGLNPVVIKKFMHDHSGGILGILEMFSGGAMGRMTIFALSIMPYISSSIIVQLMTSVSPSLEALKKEGETGRKKINQYTRYGAVFLALAQSFGIAVGLEKIVNDVGSAVLDPGVLFKLTTMVTLTGGTLFIMWLGEQITSRGISNGTSLIIYSGIVATLPQAVINTLNLGREGILSSLTILLIMICIAAVMYYVVFIEKAQRRITIQYPKRQSAANMPASSQSTHLPLKLNSAGVIPPIFASSLLLLPGTIIGFSGSADPNSIMSVISRYFSHGNPVYITIFALMIIFFSFFYTALVFNPEETAENLRKAGNYIPGIRPGKSTADFLDFVLTRLTVVGSLYLASICVLPEFIFNRVSLPFYFGGTTIIIVVSVTMETISQIQSHIMVQQYPSLLKLANKGKKR